MISLEDQYFRHVMRMQLSEASLRALLLGYGQAPCLPETAGWSGHGFAFGQQEFIFADATAEALRTQLGRYMGLRPCYSAACIDQHGRCVLVSPCYEQAACWWWPRMHCCAPLHVCKQETNSGGA